MKITLEFDTSNLPTSLQFQKMNEWLLWMANNAPADISVIGAPAAAFTPPPVPNFTAPPSPPADAYLAGITAPAAFDTPPPPMPTTVARQALDLPAPPAPVAQQESDVTPPPPPPPPAGNVTPPPPAGHTDSAGTPWDERIHASSKTVKGDGTWTRRRGVDDLQYGAVMLELTAAASGTPVKVAADRTAMPPPPPPAAGVVPPAGGVLPKVEMLIDAVMAGKLTNQQIERACILRGVKNLEELQSNEAKLTEVIDGFTAAGLL